MNLEVNMSKVENNTGVKDAKPQCKNCPGYRYDKFMDDTFYCNKYAGTWDEYKRSRVCVYTNTSPICDACTRKNMCTFMCETRIDQLVKEEAESNKLCSPESEEVTKTAYLGWDSGKHKPIEETVTLVRMPRFQGKVTTRFSKKFPVPIACKDFCSKSATCNLRNQGFTDPCKLGNKLGKLVMPVDPKWSARFNKQKADEIKARTHFAKSSIRGIVPEIALAHERTEDNTHGAYSSQNYLDSNDDPEENGELAYSMDTGMATSEKSQAAAVPSFMYRTTYRDRRSLLGFQARTVESACVITERDWTFDPASHNFSYTERVAIQKTSYREDLPLFKWERLPTLRPIGCHMKALKVIGSSTVVTRKERAFYSERNEVKRQEHHSMEVHIIQDEIDARSAPKQVVMATC